MNNRIRELAIAAAPVDSAIPQSEWNIPKEFIEKFAELIVRECADQCTTDGPFCAEVIWGQQFHKKILNHFGIEE